MQLIISNKSGKQVTFTNGGPYVIKAFKDGGIPVTVTNAKGMKQHGYKYEGNTTESRQLTLDYAVIGDDEYRLIGRLESLYEVINPDNGECTISQISELGNKYLIDAVVDNMPAYENKGILCKESSVKFICSNPLWRGEDAENRIAYWANDLHFPLSFPQNGIPLGHREPSLIVNVLNNGDIDCGISIELNALGTLKNPSLTNISTGKCIKIIKSMKYGEKITINTRYGQKGIDDNVNGIITDILNQLDYAGGNICFLQVQKGDNLLRYDAEENLNNLEVKIVFSPMYMGVR